MNKRIEKIPGYARVEKLKNNKQAIAFLACVVIATALWFLNALSKDYSTTISYPVKYVNAPARQFLANEPPSKLELKVDAHGFTLLRHKLSLSFSPIILNLTNITKGVQPQNRTYEVHTSRHQKRIASQITNEITIREVLPEVLYIVLDSLKSKSVPVKAAIELAFKPQFNLQNPIELNPKEVMITGPAASIDTIQFLYAEKKSYKDVDATIENNLEVLHPDKTTIVPEEVLLKIDVEKFTEKELEIPIQIKNKPADVNLKLFPSVIKVTCMVGLSEFNEITSTDFRAVVDYNNINSSSSKLAVQIELKPSFIELIRFTPENVEYLIETY